MKIVDKLLLVITFLLSSFVFSQKSYSNIELNNESFRKELELFIDEIEEKYSKLFKTEKVISINIKKNEKNSTVDIRVFYGLASSINKNFKGLLDMDYKGAIIMIYSDENYIKNFYYEKCPVKFSEKQISPFVIQYTINGLEVKYTSSTFPAFDNDYTYELKGGIYKLVNKKY